MRIPAEDAIIAPDKLTKYLLIPQVKNDKSQFLGRLGFTLANPDALDTAIRRILEDNEAVKDREDEYGISYRVSGALVGPDGAVKPPICEDKCLSQV
jgi:hypothetical protein